MSKGYLEESVTIHGDVCLKGTLTLPDEKTDKLPGILLISGSGPLDRNANDVKGKFRFNLYYDLADLITKLGFVTLRYDKRGVGESEGVFIKTGFLNLVDDAEQALMHLKNHPRVDEKNIIVLGHSEGCIIGSALSSRQEIQGLMLISGALESLSGALKVQRDRMYEELMASPGLKGWLFKKLKLDEKGEKSAQKVLEKCKTTDKDVIRVQLFFKQPAKYYREHMAYDPIEDLKHITCPVFAISGDKDPLLRPERVYELEDIVKGEVDAFVIKNMEHGLKEQLTPPSTLNAKKDMKASEGKPIIKEALEKIETWLLAHYK